MSTPDERHLRAQIAAHSRHADQDPIESTQAARAARWRLYEDRVDPDHLLDAEERRRRARHAMRADLARYSLMGAQARREQAQRRRQEADDALADALIEAAP